MTATCFATASRSRAEAGVRSAALEGDAVAKHHRHAVRQQAAAGTLHQGKSIASGDMLGRSPYHRVDPTQVGPSPFFDCGSAAAEPHIRSPLTSRLAPKSLMLEVVRLGRADHSLSRHLAARTLCGPP